MELEQLKQLVAIDRFGTMSNAAEHLHITQPSLSRSMKRLEHDLGQDLFTRSANRATLNDAGRLALSHAHAILAEERKMHEAFDTLARRQRTIKVASVAPAPNWRLSSLIVQQFPGTILEPDIVSESEAAARLLNHEADIAIALHPSQAPESISIPFMTESLSLSVSHNHPLASRKSVSFADMDGEAFLIFEQIGFWMEIGREQLKNSQVIIQKDRMVFAQLLQTTDLLAFTTDAVDLNEDASSEGRVTIPIIDAQAHATFFLLARNDASQRVQDIVHAVQ